MAKSSGVYEAIHFLRLCLLDGSTLPKCTVIGSPPGRRKVQKMSVLGCLRAFFSIYFVYSASIVLLQPFAEAGQLKLHTNQQMIEELLEPTASIAEILMPRSKGAAFYKDKMTAADFSSRGSTQLARDPKSVTAAQPGSWRASHECARSASRPQGGCCAP